METVKEEIIFKFEGTMQQVLTWEDMEILESGKIGRQRTIVARFLVDKDGIEIPFDKAMKKLGPLKLEQVNEVISEFMKLMSEGAVNPTTADS